MKRLMLPAACLPLVIVSRFYGLRNSVPQTSAAPRCPAIATRAAAAKSAPRYTTSDRRD